MLHRRDAMIRLGQLGAGSLLLPTLAAASQPVPRATADACIYLFLLNIHGSKTGYDLLRSPVCLPPLDQGLSALLEDLDDRGVLGRTLVAAAGEFGRTPKVNKDGGRDHWGPAGSLLFAGGGATGGQVIGRTDKQGAYPTDRPVSPEDFLATIHTARGVSPQAELHDREGRPQPATTGPAIRGVLG